MAPVGPATGVYRKHKTTVVERKASTKDQFYRNAASAVCLYPASNTIIALCVQVCECTSCESGEEYVRAARGDREQACRELSRMSPQLQIVRSYFSLSGRLVASKMERPREEIELTLLVLLAASFRSATS